MAVSAASVSRACSLTSRPGMLTKQNATWQPSLPNSMAMWRPRPVAPPVTIATLPRQPCGRAAAAAPRGRHRSLPEPGIPTRAGDRTRRMARAWASKVRRARGEGKECRALHLTPRRLLIARHAPRPSPGWLVAPRRRRRLGRAGPPPRRDDQRRLARPRRGRYLPPRPSASTAASSPTGSSASTTAAPRRPSGWPTAATTCRPPAGCSSATTSPPSPAPARWSGRCWRPSSATCRGPSGS